MTPQQFFAKYQEIEKRAEKIYSTISFPWPQHSFDGFEIEEQGITIKYSSFHCYSCKDGADDFTKFVSWEDLGIDFNENDSIIIPKEMEHG